MKIKVFRYDSNSSLTSIEVDVNDFIKDKDVVDIKVAFAGQSIAKDEGWGLDKGNMFLIYTIFNWLRYMLKIN